jgi:hypothetical protein
VKVTMNENNEKGKRQRIDDSVNELEDSLQSLISDYKSINEPTNKDTGDLICNFMSQFAKLHLNIVELRETNERAINKLNSHDSRISAIEEENRAHKQQQTTIIDKHMILEKKINILEQSKIDKDIYVKGFTAKPNLPDISRKFEILLQLEEDCIADSYCFENKSHNRATSTPTSKSYCVVLSTRTTKDKSNFFTKKKENGPILVSQLQDKCKSATAKLSITNRLTKFNLKSSSIAWELKKVGIITEYSLRNGLIVYKMEKTGKWIEIATEADQDRLAAKNKITNENEELENSRN